jgi:hypothetical protein
MNGQVARAIDPFGLEEIVSELSKKRVEVLAKLYGVGTQYPEGSLSNQRKVGRWVQNTVLKCVSLEENGRRFPSEERFRATGRQYVQPDGVADQKYRAHVSLFSVDEWRKLLGSWDEVRHDSSFYEVKVLELGKQIHQSDSEYQIRGLVDALSKQEAAQKTEGLPPILHFATTKGVGIGNDVVAFATEKKVLVIQHVIEEVYDTETRESHVRIGAGRVLNPIVMAARLPTVLQPSEASDAVDWNGGPGGKKPPTVPSGEDVGVGTPTPSWNTPEAPKEREDD